MKTAVFDTETTGIPKHPNAKDGVQPRVIEFAGVIVNKRGTVLEELSLLINPEQPLEEIITKITGLTDEDLAQEPTFVEVAPQIRAFFDKADAVLAHNLPFDSNMLNLEATRNNLEPWPWLTKLMICTVQEHAEEWGRRPKLTELYEHYAGKPLAQTHRAMDDTKALAFVAKAAGVLL